MDYKLNLILHVAFFPCQVSSRNSVELIEDDREEQVNSIAEQLGLRRVGWIFTDLVAQDLKTGTVRHFRGNIVCIQWHLKKMLHQIWSNFDRHVYTT